MKKDEEESKDTTIRILMLKMKKVFMELNQGSILLKVPKISVNS